MKLIIDLTESELAKLEEITKTSFFGAEIDAEVSDAISKLLESQHCEENGFKWLKIDGISIKREKPRLWYDNIPMILNYIPITYEIRIGHTTVEITLEDSEDELIVIDSKKLDEAIRERKRQGVIP